MEFQMNTQRILKLAFCASAFTGLVTASMGVSAGPGRLSAQATGSGQSNKLQCFAGPTDGSAYGGVCTLTGSGANVKAVLNNTDNNPNGDYSGIYLPATSLSGAPLKKVTQLGYTYTSAGNVMPTPGSLSLNVPIDTDGNGATDYYAFIDAAYCPGTGGVVDVIRDANCGIYLNNNYYANWAALVAAYPAAKIATDDVPFIIAERTPGQQAVSWTITNVKLGKAR